jgi:adenosylhomocysteine nucleosidase
MIAIVAALPEEARALGRCLRERRRLPQGRGTIGQIGRQEVALLVTGDGARRAAEGLEQLVAAAPLRGVIGIGFAGALSEGLDSGALIVARGIVTATGPLPPPHPGWVARARENCGAAEVTIVSVPTLLVAAEQKAEARSCVATGPAAADLESAAWAAAASRAGIPYLILRVVTDTADEGLPPILAKSLRDDGSVDRIRLVRSALLRPSSIRPLLRMAGRARRCARVIAGGLQSLLTAAPPLEEVARGGPWGAAGSMPPDDRKPGPV